MRRKRHDGATCVRIGWMLMVVEAAAHTSRGPVGSEAKDELNSFPKPSTDHTRIEK